MAIVCFINCFPGGIDISKAKEILRAEDKFDRQVEKEKVRQRKLEEKRKKKEAQNKRKKVGTISAVGYFCQIDDVISKLRLLLTF